MKLHRDDVTLAQRIKAAVERNADVTERKARAARRAEKRRIAKGLGASFLEAPGEASSLSGGPGGGAHTDRAGAGVGTSLTPPPSFLPPPPLAVDNGLPTQIVWSPQPGPQYHFIHCPVTDVVFGGARGGGKTYALIGDAAIRAGRYGKDFRGLFLRRQQTELADVKMKMAEVYTPIGAKWSEQHQTWTFPGGGTLVLKYLMNDDDALLYKGWNVTALYVDEIGDLGSRRTIDLLWGAMRSARGIPIVRRMSCNPGGPGHCLREGDVLTPSGWVDIAEIGVGDPIFTVAPSGEMVKAVVSQKHVHQYDGELVRARARGLYVECTPQHRVAKVGGHGKNPDGTNINRKKRAAPKFSLVPFQDLPGQATILRSVSWAGTPIGEFVLPVLGRPARRPKLAQPMQLTGAQYAEFMGWFLSEGCSLPRYGFFNIAQSKPRGRRLVADMLARCGFSFRQDTTSFTVYSRAWAGYLARYGKSREKHVPVAVKNGTPEELRLFLTAAMDGDGHWEKRGESGTYYTISESLADDMAEIALKLGFVVHQSSRSRRRRVGLSYAVNIKTVKSGGTELLTGNHVYSVKTETKRRSDVARVPYSGPVYCLGIDGTQSFVVRQNGSVWVSGNSWVKQLYLSHGRYRVFKYTPNPELPDMTIDAVFIPSRLEDNKILMQNDPLYETRLSAACGGDMVLYHAWREGDWDGLAGAYFTFDEKIHVAVPPPIPPYLQRWMAIDWGYTHPTAVLWGVDFGDRAFIYRERLYTNTEPVALGMFIAEVNGDEPISNVYLSPDAFAKRTSVNTIASELEEGFRRANEMKGLSLIPSPEMAFNDRVNGWQILAAGLNQGRLLVSPSCAELIRTLPSMVRDPRKPNDIQKVDGDDVVDCARYLWATRNRGQVSLPMETRAAQAITAVDPNFRAMQERRFLAQEAAAGGDGSGVTMRGRRRFFSGWE